MSIYKWCERNLTGVENKTVALTGATGGLGQEICRYLLAVGARIILMDRNQKKSASLKEKLKAEFPFADIRRIPVDMEDIFSVKKAVEALKAEDVDILLHNAGAYNIPRHSTAAGYDNVFMIDFASPYYLTKEILPTLELRGGHVVAVGSIAYRYSATDRGDWDFTTRSASHMVYGNAKRRLMFSLYELFKNETKVSLTVAHPGISFTGITDHYPPLLFALIKYPMKVIFPKPYYACRPIVKGMTENTGYGEWIGPSLFDVWGKPKRSILCDVPDSEKAEIFEEAEEVYHVIKKTLGE